MTQLTKYILKMEYTKYEKARIIGARALQISMGAPFIIKLTDSDLRKIRYNTVNIAKMEFDKGLIPITVKRLLPSEMKKSPAEERDILEDIYRGEDEGEEPSEKKEEEYAEDISVDEEDDTV